MKKTLYLALLSVAFLSTPDAKAQVTDVISLWGPSITVGPAYRSPDGDYNGLYLTGGLSGTSYFPRYNLGYDGGIEFGRPMPDAQQQFRLEAHLWYYLLTSGLSAAYSLPNKQSDGTFYVGPSVGVSIFAASLLARVDFPVNNPSANTEWQICAKFTIPIYAAGFWITELLSFGRD